MALSDGEPAEPADIWLRVITNERYIRADGRLNNQAFKGAIAPPDIRRTWSHELSGRLKSLINDIAAESLQFCGVRQKPFVGVMHAVVSALRTQIDNRITTDACYTPKPDDGAHADFVTFDSVDDDLPRIRDWLQEIVKVARANAVSAIGAEADHPTKTEITE
jgi:hypothetical protein